jgi:hypothetical protein
MRGKTREGYSHAEVQMYFSMEYTLAIIENGQPELILARFNCSQAVSSGPHKQRCIRKLHRQRSRTCGRNWWRGYDPFIDSITGGRALTETIAAKPVAAFDAVWGGIPPAEVAQLGYIGV